MVTIISQSRYEVDNLFLCSEVKYVLIDPRIAFVIHYFQLFFSLFELALDKTSQPCLRQQCATEAQQARSGWAVLKGRLSVQHITLCDTLMSCFVPFAFNSI